MLAYISALLSWLAGRFCSRAELELEVIAHRHQLAVLRRQRPGRAHLSALDRLFWTWLYRVWPPCLNILVLVKPATVVEWHVKASGFIGVGAQDLDGRQ
jgi:putative transposase